MAAISLSGVGKRFGASRALAGIDAEIGHGEFVVIVGPSGCGKSTLLRLIAGLEPVSEGDIHIDGERVNDHSPPERGIAMVFQSYALYPHMTVYKNIAFGLKMDGRGRAEIERKVRAVAETLQLTPLLTRYPRQLSGGQRQRVAIGRAIVRDPKIFLFDEPLSNLDAALRVQTRMEISKLHRALHTTMVYVTHDQIEAMTLADKIIVLDHGRIAQTGAPLELYRRPRNVFVAGFIGSPKMNFLEATVTSVAPGRLRVETAGGAALALSIDAPGLQPGERLRLGVRPEHLCEGERGALRLRGRVEELERLGDVSYVYARCDDGQLTAAVAGDSRLRHNDPITLCAAAERVLVFDAAGDALLAAGDQVASPGGRC